MVAEYRPGVGAHIGVLGAGAQTPQASRLAGAGAPDHGLGHLGYQARAPRVVLEAEVE